jgi:hypothetical protein
MKSEAVSLPVIAGVPLDAASGPKMMAGAESVRGSW